MQYHKFSQTVLQHINTICTQAMKHATLLFDTVSGIYAATEMGQGISPSLEPALETHKILRHCQMPT